MAAEEKIHAKAAEEIRANYFQNNSDTELPCLQVSQGRTKISKKKKKIAKKLKSYAAN